MKKDYPVEFVYQVLSLIVAVIVVHAFYVPIVRPKADDVLAEQTARMQADPDYVQERSVWVIIRDFEQEACFVLMLWALAIMAYKRTRPPGSEQLLQAGPGAAVGEARGSCPRTRASTRARSSRCPAPSSGALLPRALLTALHRFSATRNIQDVSTTAHGVCEAESERLESELSMVRYIAWAIPSIGFIGTVRGIGDALGQAHKAVEGDIAGVTQSLGVAFNSTFIALLDQHRADVPAAPAAAAPGAAGARHRDLSRSAPDPAPAGSGDSVDTARVRVMTTVAVELNDAGVVAAGAGLQWKDRSPGIALLDGHRILVGREAVSRARLKPRWVANRFWDRLDTQPLGRPFPRDLRNADLVHAHLTEVWQRVRQGMDSRSAPDIEAVVLAVPGFYSERQLGLLLGVGRACGMPIAGMVDAAVAASVAATKAERALHVDVLLQRVVLTEMGQAGSLARQRVESEESTGLAKVMDLWAKLIASRFVQQTRFDPFHHGETEQDLYDRLPGWIDEIGRDGGALLTLEHRGKVHRAEISAGEIQEAVGSSYRADRPGSCRGCHGQSAGPGAHPDSLEPTRHSSPSSRRRWAWRLWFWRRVRPPPARSSSSTSWFASGIRKWTSSPSCRASLVAAGPASPRNRVQKPLALPRRQRPSPRLICFTKE